MSANDRGSDLAHGMADHHVGTRAGVAPQRRQRDLHREDQRLKPVDPRLQVALQRGERRPSGDRSHRAIAAQKGCPKCRRAGHQAAAHADPLATLAGEHEHQWTAGVIWNVNRRRHQWR